jgi:hypothetical protein
MRKSFGAAIAALFLSGAAAGQTITVGSLPPTPNTGFNPTPVTLTAVDLSFPATGTGDLTSATFSWSSAPCAGTVKVKFFRRSGDLLFFVAERGPFDTNGTTQTVSLTPPVSVQAGDLIGVSRVASCGSPVGFQPGGPSGLVAFSGDISSGVSISFGSVTTNATLAVTATGTASGGPGPNPASVIPVVISSPGAAGSNFRVGVQIYNPGATIITGRIVFHAQGASASPSDPAVQYALNPGQTQSLGDILATLGLTGIGSADIFVTSGVAPVATARVFNDSGALGTSGFTEDAFKPTEALSAGARGVLLGPADAVLFRYNVGVRTLAGGATIAVTARDSTGTVLRAFSRTYPANFFQQTDASTFLGVLPLLSNESFTVDVVSGSLFLYGATADNRTNDSAIQFAKNTF